MASVLRVIEAAFCVALDAKLADENTAIVPMSGQPFKPGKTPTTNYGTKDKIIVAFQRSTWGEVLQKFPAIQKRGIFFRVGYEVNSAKTPLRAEDLLDASTAIILAVNLDLSASDYSQTDTINAVSDGFLSYQNGVWTYASLFLVPTKLIQTCIH
jgi:hypothetical protein